MATKKLPYGLSDFRLLQTDDYYYVDKTRFIEEVENSPRFLFMIRPRRFGKSLWLSILESYYDVAFEDRFEELFGKYYIGQHPTSERNKYLILSFNFAGVSPDIDRLEQSFWGHLDLRLMAFNLKYAHLFPADYMEGYHQCVNAEQRFGYVMLRCQFAKFSVYLIIDEYDNFTNVVLSKHGHERYHELTHAAGFYRAFFNKLKEATTGGDAAVKRMFITGVSPVTLDDVTSGFNIAHQASMEARFNEFLGFTENEVREMLEYYKNEGCLVGNVEERLEIMREWYDNYCFSKSCCNVRMYNSDMVLYFVNSLITSGCTPDSLVDPNVKTDYAKLRYLIILDKKLNGNFSRIKQIAEDGEIVSDILPGFPAEELVKPTNFVSLLFYFGILTIDREEEGMVILKIPNLTIRQMLFSYLERGYLEAGVFEIKMMELSEMMRYMAYRGEWRQVFEYFGKELRNQTSIRDYIEGEKAVQTLHLVYMGLTNHFTIWPEQELGKGYCDLWMAPNLVNHPGMKYSYVVEFKYLKHGATDQEVANKLEEAKEQLRRYADDKKIKAQAGLTEIRYIAVVYRAWELVKLEEVSMANTDTPCGC